MFVRKPALAFLCLTAVSTAALAADGKNLLQDPSFEIPKDRDQFGLVFKHWGGWKYEGECDFRVGRIARTGKTSCLLFGGAAPKIRVRQTVDLEPGRYRITGYIRGLDLGTGVWNATTEFMFDDKYMQLKKNGTFGWTKLTYVAEVKAKKNAGPSFGLMAPGYFWIDDVTMEKVGDDVALTEQPVLGQEEAPIAPPGELTDKAIRCVECGYKNMPEWKTCYACGTPLEARRAVATGPATKTIATFEEKNPFDGGTVVTEHATEGKKALRIDKSYVAITRPQDWTGYDFLEADLYTDARDPLQLYVEVRDTGTRDYWTRVNYTTVVPPGQSTLIIPIKQLYVGEKSRPGRMLDLANVVHFVLSISDKPSAPLFVDNVRLQRDESVAKVVFDGLWAFDFGTGTSPVMEGFTQVTPATLYSKGRGYGLKDARIWRAMDVLQPDPLYQDFICMESGGLAVDVPNGRYRVFVNIDNPSGFWGEYQVYRKRAILAEGRPVVTDTMDFETLKKKYFRFWDSEDLPTDNTFDKYQKVYYREKTFEVEVTDGQLNLGFQGENWGCSVAAVVIFPVAKAAEGERFLKFVEGKRRFHFDNYFKRILHRATGDPVSPTAADMAQGFVVFQRDAMQDVYYNDTPTKDEMILPLSLRERAGVRESGEKSSGSTGVLRGEAFAGEYEPLTVAIVPLHDLGRVTVSIGDLRGPAGVIPAEAVDVGYVSYRISRVSMEGTVYTIQPRLIMPCGSRLPGGIRDEVVPLGKRDLPGVDVPKDITRRFWLTVKTPADAKQGVYKGSVEIKPAKGPAVRVPVEFRVRAGTLDPVDVPAGPWSYTIGVPWDGNDPAAAAFNEEMTLKSLRKMREYGCTTFSGVPTIHYQGFKDGKPVLDFAAADKQMALAKELGFLKVVSYGSGVSGFDAYFQDAGQMNAAGLNDYSEFVRRIYAEVQKHADAAGWIPVYYNLADEPIGDALTRSAENAEAYRKAFPKGPPWFTGASSFSGDNAKDPHFRLAKAFHVADWNGHDEPAVKLQQAAGSDWAFYNGGNRWTFGEYMYKAAKQFDMKFRISWHWNATAGDPYYALDCREDDYAWCNASPDGRLIPAIHFEHVREGLDDYRRLITLARLAKEKAGSPAAKAAEDLLAARMAAFRLGEREMEPIHGATGWTDFRRKIDDAIESLRK